MGPNLPKKSISAQKWKKWPSLLDFAYSSKSRYQISAQTHIFEFWDQICPKRVFPVKSRSEHHHWVFTIGSRYQASSQSDNFHFLDQIYPKIYFRSKTEKVNIIIQFSKFKLVFVPNFTLNKQFWILEANLPKKGTSSRKWKNWTLPANSSFSNHSRH